MTYREHVFDFSELEDVEYGVSGLQSGDHPGCFEGYQGARPMCRNEFVDRIEKRHVIRFATRPAYRNLFTHEQNGSVRIRIREEA